MPSRVYPIREQLNEEAAADTMINILPLLQPSLIQSIFDDSKDKTMLKTIWAKSQPIGEFQFEVQPDVSERDLSLLRSSGLIEVSGRIIKLTQRGARLLRESILNDEKSSFTKKASKQLISKNSYDFGDKVLVKMANADTFGTKYMFISKNKFNKKAKPQTIDSYNIKTKANGKYKKLKDYTEAELIKILHLAKTIVDNSHQIVVASSDLQNVPVHRIKYFSEIIMKELNSR